MDVRAGRYTRNNPHLRQGPLHPHSRRGEREGERDAVVVAVCETCALYVHVCMLCVLYVLCALYALYVHVMLCALYAL